MSYESALRERKYTRNDHLATNVHLKWLFKLENVHLYKQNNRENRVRQYLYEIWINVHFDGNVRYKQPVWVTNDYLTCFGSCPWAFLRCWFRFLVLVNGSAAPLLHPATGHGNGPTLLGLPGHTLQWSLLLFALRKSPAPHPSHFLSAFLKFWCVMLCFWRPAKSTNIALQPFLGQKTFLSFPHVFKCSVRDLPEDSFLPQPALRHTFFCSPVWVFMCLLYASVE